MTLILNQPDQKRLSRLSGLVPPSTLLGLVSETIRPIYWRKKPARNRCRLVVFQRPIICRKKADINVDDLYRDRHQLIGFLNKFIIADILGLYNVGSLWNFVVDEIFIWMLKWLIMDSFLKNIRWLLIAEL